MPSSPGVQRAAVSVSSVKGVASAEQPGAEAQMAPGETAGEREKLILMSKHRQSKKKAERALEQG